MRNKAAIRIHGIEVNSVIQRSAVKLIKSLFLYFTIPI
jgi:hypothetical protein